MNKIRAVFALIMSAVAMQAATKVTSADFGKTREGTPVRIYTLTNASGAEAAITNYGARIVSLKVPDRNGTMGDVVIGFNTLDGYLGPNPYFGAIVGRYANRIGHAEFKLDGTDYKLAKNNGDNALHGGLRGFDRVVWTAREMPDGGLELTYLSKDGEEGYPGNCKVTVRYHLTDANELKIEYSATTDKDTVINLSNHAYFNLKGGGDILGHVLTLNSDRFTPVDAGLIPTAELRAVAGTPFDFRKATVIGARIDQNDQQLKAGKGYDLNWVLNKKGDELSLAARLEEPSSGRVMEVWTTQPGIQFYTGNNLDGTLKGKGGNVYTPRSALCLETQHYPDSPNKPSFPSTVLKPGMEFKSTTIYRFTKAGAR
jgi:aldose 1-epimerase